MKKAMLLIFVFVFIFASMSSAEIKLGIGTPFIVLTTPNTSSLVYGYDQPTFVISFDDTVDLVLGYRQTGQGKDEDPQTDTLGGIVWYMMKRGPIVAGPSVFFYSDGVNTGGGDKASDNTITHTIIGLSVKAAIIPGIDLRTDVVLSDSIGGKIAGFDVEGVSETFSRLQVSAVINFL